MLQPLPPRTRARSRAPHAAETRRARLRAFAFGALASALVGCVSVVPEPPESRDHSLRFVAASGVVTVEGRFSSWRVVASRVEPDDLATSFVEVEIDVASIETGIDDRDAHLRDPDFFEVERWPTATVRVADVTPTEDPRVFDATFDVRIKQHRRSLEGSFRVESRDPFVVAGELQLDRVAFGVGDAPSALNPFDPRAEVRVLFRLSLASN